MQIDHAGRAWRVFVSLLAPLVLFAAILAVAVASPAGAAGTRVRAIAAGTEERVGPTGSESTDQVGRLRPSNARFVSAAGVATEEAGAAASAAPEGAGSNWVSRVADNGKGVVWQEPGAVGNANSIRIMEPTAQYANAYVRSTTNTGSQSVWIAI